MLNIRGMSILLNLLAYVNKVGHCPTGMRVTARILGAVVPMVKDQGSHGKIAITDVLLYYFS
jgi:hypothetical protein